MGPRYSQLSLEERCRLRGLMEMELPKTEIARRLGRHRGMIDRELARNSNVDGYRPGTADRPAWGRRLRGSRIGRSTRLNAHIILNRTLSPFVGLTLSQPFGFIDGGFNTVMVANSFSISAKDNYIRQKADFPDNLVFRMLSVDCLDYCFRHCRLSSLSLYIHSHKQA